MPIKRSGAVLLATATTGVFLSVVSFSLAHAAPLMVVGNDEKVLWDDEGKPVLSPAGKDSVLIVDLANPEDPKIVANLPLKNSVDPRCCRRPGHVHESRSADRSLAVQRCGGAEREHRAHRG